MSYKEIHEGRLFVACEARSARFHADRVCSGDAEATWDELISLWDSETVQIGSQAKLDQLLCGRVALTVFTVFASYCQLGLGSASAAGVAWWGREGD